MIRSINKKSLYSKSTAYSLIIFFIITAGKNKQQMLPLPFLGIKLFCHPLSSSLSITPSSDHHQHHQSHHHFIPACQMLYPSPQKIYSTHSQTYGHPVPRSISLTAVEGKTEGVREIESKKEREIQRRHFAHDNKHRTLLTARSLQHRWTDTCAATRKGVNKSTWTHWYICIIWCSGSKLDLWYIRLWCDAFLLICYHAIIGPFAEGLS